MSLLYVCDRCGAQQAEHTWNLSLTVTPVSGAVGRPLTVDLCDACLNGLRAYLYLWQGKGPPAVA